MELSELLQQAQRLTNETKMDAEVPRVERTLTQVLQATQQLHSRVTHGGTNDLQAHILLGAKGVDLPELRRKLETLNSRISFEPLDPIADTDVRAYLRNESENAIITVINETNHSIFEAVERRKWLCTHADWGKEKNRLLNALVGPGQRDFPNYQENLTRTILNEAPEPQSRLNTNETLYAIEIKKYNRLQLQGGIIPNLICKFTELAKKSFQDRHIDEMWSVLKFMTDEEPLSRNIDPIKTRQSSPKFINQASHYLQYRFRDYMNSVIDQNLVIACRGGVPTLYNTVVAFGKVIFYKPHDRIGMDDLAYDVPFWPLVFYALRAGHSPTAIQLLKNFRYSDDLLTFMELKENASDDVHSSKLKGQLKLEYSKNLRNSTDQFKKAVFAVVLGCDPNEVHKEVIRTTDDFLWLQLAIIRTDDDRDYNIEKLTYAGLQSLIVEKYGENYFNAQNRPSLYFQALVLTGQFEAAIEFLARTFNNCSHAVHMAIALNELCMLGAPASVQDPMLSAADDDPLPLRRLNLARLVIMYVKRFEQTNMEEALHYYYLLRNFKTIEGDNMFLGCVCSLVLENCNDDTIKFIFGTESNPDFWNYRGGVITQFYPMEHEMCLLAGLIGNELVNRGFFESAVTFYFIGKQYEKAIKVVSSLLTQVVHQEPCPGKLRDRLQNITERLTIVINSHQYGNASHVVVRTFQMLSELMKFYNHYYANERRLALEVLIDNKLAPSRNDKIDECVSNLKRFGPEFIKQLPDVLLTAMKIIFEEYNSLKGNDSQQQQQHQQQEQSKNLMMRHLRDNAKAIVNMVDVVPYRIPSDTNRLLIQMEILMH